jgi:signal transduction histidine kinase
VSHELRNPLNSIKAQNILKRNLYNELKKILPQPCRILDDLESGLEVQDTSSNLMSSMIQDLLDYSQIKAGKFRKNISRFNIRTTV